MSLINQKMDRWTFVKKAFATMVLPVSTSFLSSCQVPDRKSNDKLEALKAVTGNKSQVPIAISKVNVKRTEKEIVPKAVSDTVVTKFLEEAKESKLGITREHYNFLAKLERLAIELIKAKKITKKQKYNAKEAIEILKVFSKTIEVMLPNRKLTTVISRGIAQKSSDCDIRSYLILHLNQSLGFDLPLYTVKAPNHLFIRWQDDNQDRCYMKNYFNWETMMPSDNKVANDEMYMWKYSISLDQIHRGIYLKNQTFNEMLSDYQFNIGFLCGELGRPNLQIEAYDSAIVTNSQNKDAYNNRGNFYFDAGNYEKARDDYMKIIKIDPEDPVAYYNLGNYHRALKQFEKSIDCFSKAISLDSSYEDAYVNRGGSFVDIGKYKQAIQDLNKALKLNPKSSFAFFNRGLAYENLGKSKKAKQDFHDAYNIEKHPWIYKKIHTR